MRSAILRKRRNIFWYRYFGLDFSEVETKRFCQAVWLHLTHEFRVLTPPLELFTSLLTSVMGAYKMWPVWYRIEATHLCLISCHDRRRLQRHDQHIRVGCL